MYTTKDRFIENKDAYFGLTPPGTISEVIASGIVSDSIWAEHCQVAVSHEGRYLFFMRQTETQDFFWVSTKIFNELKKQSLK